MTNREAYKIMKEVLLHHPGHPVKIIEGYTTLYNGIGGKGCRYVFMQWYVHGFIMHANFFFKV